MNDRPILRHKGAAPPAHIPLDDDLRELCSLVSVLRAWSYTGGDQEDAGRDHNLYPLHQYRDGSAREGPLWAAIERVLSRHGFGRNQR